MKLEQIIPNPEVRKPIYSVFAGLGLILGAIQVGFASAEVGQPVWLTVSMAVYAFLAGMGFTLSQANTVTPSAKQSIVGTSEFEDWAGSEELDLVSGSDDNEELEYVTLEK